MGVGGEKERETGRKERKERNRGWGREEVTETNAPALTAVLHFLTDRCKIEDQKSNESLED